MTENMQIRENVNTGNMGECYQKFLWYPSNFSVSLKSHQNPKLKSNASMYHCTSKIFLQNNKHKQTKTKTHFPLDLFCSSIPIVNYPSTWIKKFIRFKTESIAIYYPLELISEVLSGDLLVFLLNA
jgi:hypothetical protein